MIIESQEMQCIVPINAHLAHSKCSPIWSIFITKHTHFTTEGRHEDDRTSIPWILVVFSLFFYVSEFYSAHAFLIIQ